MARRIVDGAERPERRVEVAVFQQKLKKLMLIELVTRRLEASLDHLFGVGAPAPKSSFQGRHIRRSDQHGGGVRVALLQLARPLIINIKEYISPLGPGRLNHLR